MEGMPNACLIGMLFDSKLVTYDLLLLSLYA